MKAAPIRALLIEDNPADAEIVREMLAEGARAPFEIEVAERLGSGIEALHQDHFDVVLADLNLPDSYGFDTFRALQECCPDTPIILLTGLEDEGIAEQALKQGAQDYLVKSQIDARSLDRSIRYAIERKHILSENVRLYDEAGDGTGVVVHRAECACPRAHRRRTVGYFKDHYREAQPGRRTANARERLTVCDGFREGCSRCQKPDNHFGSESRRSSNLRGSRPASADPLERIIECH